MDFAREYKKLNNAQRRAVDKIDGPLIVVAGPGTGKTQLLSMRTANILKKTDALPENILCLTFTEAAAENMRNRLLKLAGKSANQVSIYTFHGFGEYVIRNYPEYFYEAPLLSQLNELAEYDLLERLLNKLHHDNPFAKKINGAYFHIRDISRAISWFKQAGLSPNNLRAETLKNQAFFKAANKLLSQPFQESPASKNRKSYSVLLESLLKILINNPSEVGKQSAIELGAAIDEIDESSRYAKSITAWRSKWLAQVKKGVWHYDDQQKNLQLIQLAEIYESYQLKLTEAGYYSFDDMILRTTNAMASNEELKLALQEKYQYILVDEYQDTNGAQDKILNQLADNPVNEGKPNLMVVGDDDQAIYRFQGANSSVMQDFIARWQPEKIVLIDSYRSSQALLDLAKGVIVNAADRLENSESDISKNLISRTNSQTTIEELESLSETENYVNVASTIKKLIDSGQPPSSIAVLAPKHRYLEELVPYLLKLKLPINYERRQQILAQPRIIEVLDLLELVSAAMKFKTKKIEALLPKILAADYWQLSPQTLWEIALEAQKDRKGWFSVLENHQDSSLRNFAETIKVLSKKSKNQSFELILGYLSGAKSIRLDNDKLWELPWREYYFSENELRDNPSGYINFMAQFETLKHAFTEWLPADSRLHTIDDFEDFINLYRRTNIKLSDTSPYTTSLDAIDVMTVFRAKGLEWENVFVLNAEEDVWGAKARGRGPSFRLPSSLRWIEPVIDSSNDLVRLFYVAVTRSRSKLYITSYQNKSSGRVAERLSWLDGLLSEPKLMPPLSTSAVVEQYEADWRDIYTNPSNDLGLLLKPQLANYKLSSTHLNDFLSVDRGGPKYFLYRHLLKVPEELNPNAMYGDAVHKTLEYIHKLINLSKDFPSTKLISDFFIEKLINQPLTNDEFKYFKKRGEDTITTWIEKNKAKFQKTDISEHDFSSEHIVISDARLTGKIDVIRSLDDNQLSVIDYKTSAPIEGWTGLNSSSAIKANNYKNQLLFYKLLVDNSSSLKGKSVAKRGIIEFTTPDEDNNFTELIYDYNESDLDRIVKLIAVVWSKIINLDLPEVDSYPATMKGIRAFEDDLLNGKI